jgi:flagellar motility protein MotE (MotC chaperone)
MTGTGRPAGGAPAAAKPGHDAATRSALAHNLFAQLKAAAEAEGTGPSAPSAAAKATAALPRLPAGPPGIPPTTVGGIRVVGPAAQARIAAATVQGRLPPPPSAPASAANPLRRAPARAAAPRVARAPKGWRPRFRLLPITIFLLVLMLGVRVGDSWRVLTRGGSLPEVAALQAQTPPPPAPGGAPADTKAPGPGVPPKEGADAPAADAGEANRSPKAETVDLELVKHLTDRREELDGRARELDQREALMVAAEKRLDQKLAELEGVRNEIQGLLKQIDDKQKAQLESLVRIYETMKPKDAARIFEALEMPVLLEVVERMKEAKTALILGAMDPIKAKDLTTALAERRRLPTVPQ